MQATIPQLETQLEPLSCLNAFALPKTVPILCGERQNQTEQVKHRLRHMLDLTQSYETKSFGKRSEGTISTDLGRTDVCNFSSAISNPAEQ